MKTNLENSFKNSLDNYELPYDSNAWASLESKLNQRMPVKKSPSKWLIAASVVGLLGVAGGTYFYTNSSEQTPIQETQQFAPDNSEQVILTENKNITASKVQKEEKSNSTSESTINKTEVSKGSEDIIIPLKETEKESNNNTLIVEKNNQNSTNGESTSLVSISVPDFKDLCLGESIQIKNTNKASLVLLTPNQEEKTIKGGQQLVYTPYAEGRYQIGYYLGNRLITKESFTVNPNPKAEFIIDESSIYKNGVPTTTLNATNSDLTYNWSFDGKSSSLKTQEAEAHFFTSGSHQIELTTTNKQGCKSTESKTITIEETYNLLAPNSFRPNEFDPKVNTFMPFALTERTSKFTLIIMDLNGNVLFKTNDSNEGWNGINNQTGQTYPSKTNFVWKVTLENPVEGERPFYNGTILIL
jgi:hypothetical protein